MELKKKLINLFNNSYQLNCVKTSNKQYFIKIIDEQANRCNLDNCINISKQRDLSIKFQWGHNHDFGDGFSVDGNMGDRHIEIIASFIDEYGLPLDLTNKKILDIGVWTGGTSLLLVALGASVVAIEEVTMYSDMVNFLAQSFAVEKQLKCYPVSLYEFLPIFANEFDYVIYSGVIYHVTDPLLSLRMIFSSLKDGGNVFIESMGINSSESVCKYEGPGIIHSGNVSQMNRTGWNYFVPSSNCLKSWCLDAGFQEADISECSNNRLKGVAKRMHFDDFCRAGLSKKFTR